MLTKGFAVYPGLDNTAAENKNLIEKAAALGYRTMFVSLHIPETDSKRLEKEMWDLLQLAAQYRIEVIADIGPETRNLLGITYLRLDDGFTPAQVKQLLAVKGKRKIVLNASTVTETFLQSLQQEDIDFRRITALHNFYPRVNTGLDVNFFLRQNALFAKYGIRVGAFIPSQAGRRGPLYEGLPSIEETRIMSASLSARLLAMLGVKEIIFGDSMPSDAELTEVAAVMDDIMIFTLEGVIPQEALEKFLQGTFTTRPEGAKDLIRTVESRKLLKGQTIEPGVMGMRPAGTVTVDNKYFGRYQGELSIVQHLLPPEFRTTVVGHIPAEEVFLLQYLKPGTKFKFRTFGF
ncbi:MAG: MupG family TIM beta-alpha barrel fold protein [Acidaminococcaceae bacterium]|jgi:hypothetical protein|nr:MupG family TIM beta-alpha barrel fold protein [Acidaminococcaceae bacterium]